MRKPSNWAFPSKRLIKRRRLDEYLDKAYSIYSSLRFLMHKQHPQTAYRKYAVLIGTISENCDKIKRAKWALMWYTECVISRLFPFRKGVWRCPEEKTIKDVFFGQERASEKTWSINIATRMLWKTESASMRRILKPCVKSAQNQRLKIMRCIAL